MDLASLVSAGGGESPELLFQVGDFVLLGGDRSFERVDVIVLLLLRLVVGGFEFLGGFDEGRQKFAIAHVVGTGLVVIAHQEDEAVGGWRIFDQILKSLRQGPLDILGYEAGAQRVVAIVIAQRSRAQFADEIQPQITVRDILFQQPVGGACNRRDVRVNGRDVEMR